MYVVLGLHKILPECLDDYLTNVRRHAANSSGEPGCVRFEVLQDQDDPTTICLLEVFVDESALEAHHGAPHYGWWMDASRDWRDGPIRERHVMDFVTPPPVKPA
jgi:quinol monooxygenase YgiN